MAEAKTDTVPLQLEEAAEGLTVVAVPEQAKRASTA
jgi:hypothetical protein